MSRNVEDGLAFHDFLCLFVVFLLLFCVLNVFVC